MATACFISASNPAFALQANVGQTLKASGTYNASATSPALYANGGTINSTGALTVNINTHGIYGISALVGGVVNLNNPTVVNMISQGAQGIAVGGIGGGGTVNINAATTIHATANADAGLVTRADSRVIASAPVNIDVSSVIGSYALVVAGAGAYVNLAGGGTITSIAQEHGGLLSPSGFIYGAVTAYSGGRLDGNNVDISMGAATTDIPTGTALFIFGGSSANLANGSITSSSTGNAVDAYDSTVTLANETITTNDDAAHGVSINGSSNSGRGRGIFASGGSLELDNTSVTTNTLNGIGVYLTAGNNATIENGSAISTSGSGATGLYADGGAIAHLSYASVSTTGAQSAALVAKGTGTIIMVDGTDVATSGYSSPGLQTVNGGTIVFSNATVKTNDPTSVGIATTGATGGSLVQVSDAMIASQGDTILTTGGPSEIDFSNVTAAPVSGTVLNAQNGHTVFNADGSRLIGTMITAWNSSSDVSLTNGTTWNMIGNSNVTNLTNDDSTIIFSSPVGNRVQQASYHTLTVNNYVGNYGTIQLNTYLGTDGSASDRLVIDGGTATGTTYLTIRNVSGPGAQTHGNGIMVVQAINGAVTNTGVNDHTTFQLSRPVASGAYQYQLYANGVATPNDQNWYLRIPTAASAGVGTLSITRQSLSVGGLMAGGATTAGSPLVNTAAAPLSGGSSSSADMSPAVSAAADMSSNSSDAYLIPRSAVPTNSVILPLALNYGYAMAGSLDDRGGLESIYGVNGTPATAYEERVVRCTSKNLHNGNATVDPNNRHRCIVRVAVPQQDATRWASSGWAHVVGARGISDQDNYWRHGADYNYTFAGLKAGLDVYAHQQADGTLDKAGLYFGYGQLSATAYGPQGVIYGANDIGYNPYDRKDHKVGTVDMDGYTLGGYWTHYAPQGWYTDAVVQGTWYTNTSAKSVAGDKISPDGFGILGSLEGGHVFQLGSGWSLIPQAQVVYENVTFDHAMDNYGIYNFHDANSFRARIGARLIRTWNMGEVAHPRLFSAWVKANIWHEFLGNTKTSVIGFLGENALTTPSSLKGTWGEISAGLKAQVSDNVNLFAIGNYQHSLDSKGKQGWDGRVGLTVKW